MDYTGYKMLQLPDWELSKLYQGKYKNDSFKENEYLIILNKQNEAIDYFKFQNNKFEKIKFPIIKNSYAVVKPKNPQQYCAIDLLQDSHIKVKILRGVYGSGKDFLMLYEALRLIEDGVYDKIIYVRPQIEVANLPSIGFLPGSMTEKLAWTLGPLYDKVGGEEGVLQLIQNEKLELVPLNFIRGRSFNNSIIYVSEGQNMTTEIVKLLIGRVGENSELWINADNHQVDKRIFEQDNGVGAMIGKLGGNPLFGYIYLPLTERSEVARLADLLD